MKNTVVGGTLTLSLALVGCGEVPDTDVEGVQGAWSEASCATATPVRIYQGGAVPAYTSATTYTNSSCGKSIVLQINNYSSTYFGAGSPPELDGRTQINWADAAPTSQGACLGMWMGAIIYQWTGTSWAFWGRDEKQGGSWVFEPLTRRFICLTPNIAFHSTFPPDPKLRVGGHFKFAVTARTANTSEAPTRAVRITSKMPSQF